MAHKKYTQFFEFKITSPKVRDYKHEYEIYHGQPEQKLQRAQRNAARKRMGCVKGDGMEVDHIVSLGNGGNNDDNNLRVIDRTTNRIKGRNGVIEAVVSKQKFHYIQYLRSKEKGLAKDKECADIDYGLLLNEVKKESFYTSFFESTKKLQEKSIGLLYKNHSTQLNLSDACSEKDFNFMRALDSIPDEMVYHEINDQGKDEYGKEIEGHITVLYGLQNENDYFNIREKLENFGPIDIEIGEISKFTNEKKGYDVIKHSIISPKLESLHKFLKDNYKNNFSFPEYTPHLTLAYVKKNSMDYILGPSNWTGTKYYFNSMMWSHINKWNLPIYFK